MKKLTKLMLVLAQLGMVGVVQASTVSLSTSTPTITHPGSVSFDVNVNFTETTSKGWFNLSYDNSLLSLTSFNYNNAFTAGVTPLTVNTTTSGSINNINNIGFLGSKSGPGILGTATFSTLGVGTANLNALASFGFRNSGDTSFISVTYSGANVQVSAVPVPAALWLMASGLSALGLGLRRRRA